MKKPSAKEEGNTVAFRRVRGIKKVLRRRDRIAEYKYQGEEYKRQIDV